MVLALVLQLLQHTVQDRRSICERSTQVDVDGSKLTRSVVVEIASNGIFQAGMRANVSIQLGSCIAREDVSITSDDALGSIAMKVLDVSASARSDDYVNAIDELLARKVAIDPGASCILARRQGLVSVCVCMHLTLTSYVVGYVRGSGHKSAVSFSLAHMDRLGDEDRFRFARYKNTRHHSECEYNEGDVEDDRLHPIFFPSLSHS